MSETGEPIEVTVTFLEMERQPRHYATLPYNRQVALLKTRQIPLHFYRYLQDRVGRKWHWVNALRIDDETLRDSLHSDKRDTRVLYLDGAPAGFFDLKLELPDHVEIAYFGLIEHAMRQGIGKWFLGEAIAAGWAHDPRKLTIQTCTMDHPAALPLYQKMGFEPVGQQKEMLPWFSAQERMETLYR